MRIIEIGCSTIGDYDGIGKHARIVTEEFLKHKDIEFAELISGNTVGFSKVEYIFSMEMCKAFLNAEKEIVHKNIDCVIVEYPFSEYNPLILLAFQKLKRTCYKNHCLLALSMHEYDRVNRIRRYVIRNFIKTADLVFVSEPYYLDKLKRLNNHLYLRTIPNHLPVENRKKEYGCNKEFVYFGLVNKSKAFKEMIGAWDAFNIDGDFHLNIVTATNLEFDEKDHRNISIFIGLNNQDVANILWKCMFSIIPVIPNIGFNNSSFVSTSQCGCIPIGIFNERLNNLDFIIPINSYDIDEFKHGLDKATKISEDECVSKSASAFSFGSKFTIQATVDMMIEGINKELRVTNI